MEVWDLSVAVMHLFLNTLNLSISISAFSMSILYVRSFFASLYIYCPYLCNCFYFLYWCFASLFWAYLQLWAFYFSVHSLCVYDLFAYLYGYFASHYGHLISLCGYYAQSLYWRFVCLHNFMFMVVLFLLSPVILHLFMDTLDLFVVFLWRTNGPMFPLALCTAGPSVILPFFIVMVNVLVWVIS